MNENIKQFLEKVEADQELQAKLAQIKDPDEAYALASSIQPGFTKEEFITEMTRMKEAMDENVTDEDLAKSAGGMSDGEQIVIGVSLVTVSASAFTGVAAAAAV